jgi:hypothetical protein
VKRLPIQAAKDLATKYDQDQVIIVAWDKKEGLTHTVSFGKTVEGCKQAAAGANLVRKALGFPEDLCHETPARAKKS